jgi:hypothetical protein
MRRDLLPVLARLRGMVRDSARRDLAAAQRRLADAERAGKAAAEALGWEAAGAGPAEFAAWLPAANRDRDAAAAARSRAEAEVAASRDVLVAARGEAEAVEALLVARRIARRRARLAAEQRLLDDLPR